MRGDVFEALCAQSGGFSDVARKWKRKAFRSAKKIASVLGIEEADALQEVLLNMWKAYCTYCKQQVRFNGEIWDVVVDGPRYVLSRPMTGERLTVARWRAHPIDKKLSAASFVYLRMCQWQTNLFALHYTAHKGYQHGDEKVLINGKERDTFVRVIFEESMDVSVSFDTLNVQTLHDVFDAHIETPEESMIFSDFIRVAWDKLDPTSRLVLGVYVLTSLPVPLCPSDLSEAEFVASVLGISVEEARASLKKVLRAMPKNVQRFEAVTIKRDINGHTEFVRRRPVQEMTGVQCA